MIRPRDASGRFINRQTWELAYRLAGERVPTRVGARNQLAPFTLAEVERKARKRPTVKPVARKPVPAPRRAKSKAKDTTRQPDTAFPRGTEFELTAKYRGKARGRGEPRALHLKIRVSLTTAMTGEQARSLLDRAVRTGVVPPGIDVHWLDWSRGAGGQGGTYDSPEHDELRSFYGIIGGESKADTRFARVAESERDL